MTQTFKSHVGFAKEVTWGTKVAPTVYIPCLTYGYDEDRKRELDKGTRAVAALDFAAYEGVESGKPSYEWNFYPDECARFYARILGTDNKSGVAAPYTHAFAMADKGASETISDFYGIANKERRFAGCYVTAVNTKFETKSGFVTQRVDFLGQAPDSGVAETVPSFPTDSPFRGWQAALTVAGGGNTRLLSFEIDMKRKVELIFGANNSKTPSAGEVFPVEVTGKCSFWMDTTDTEYGYFVDAATENAVVVTITGDVLSGGNYQLIFTLTKFLWEKVQPKRPTPEGYLTAEVSFRGIYNTTDAGPAAVSVLNSISTAY